MAREKDPPTSVFGFSPEPVDTAPALSVAEIVKATRALYTRQEAEREAASSALVAAEAQPVSPPPPVQPAVRSPLPATPTASALGIARPPGLVGVSSTSATPA